MSAATQMADILCKPAPLAVRAAKQAMIQGTSRSLGDGLELEKALTDFLVTTEDFDEGCAAFLEKRKAEFKVK
jgi:enoyl-CoA hydratase/carnithine racemase